VSLFDAGVRIYESNNNGRWYEFGFVLGISVSFGGSSSQTRRVASSQVLQTALLLV
jgi:hypothetical protein